MSQPLSPEPSESPDGTVVQDDGKAAASGFRRRLAHLPRPRGARLAALAGVAVILGAGTAAVAEHGPEHKGSHHEGRGGYSAGHERSHASGPDGDRRRHGGGDRLSAPIPLPALAADQAVGKAAGAVPGGKIESLDVIPQQGGGSAWEAVVLGPDGVRHRVTLDGTNGTVTGNTVTTTAGRG